MIHHNNSEINECTDTPHQLSEAAIGHVGGMGEGWRKPEQMELFPNGKPYTLSIQ